MYLRYKIALLALLLASTAQAQPITKRGDSTVQTQDYNVDMLRRFKIPTAADTAHALIGRDSVGLLVYVRSTNQVYYRDTSAPWGHKWTLMAGSGGGGGGTGSADSLKHLFVDTGSAARNAYYLGFDSVNRKWKLYALPDTGSLSARINGKMTNYGGAPGVLQDVLANRPVSGAATGQLFYATDTKVLYRWTGSAWDPVTVIDGAITNAKLAQMPANTFKINPTGSLANAQDANLSTMLTAIGLDTARANLWAAIAARMVNLGAATGVKAGAYLSRPSASNSQSFYWSADSVWLSYDGAGPAWKDLKPGTGGGGGTDSAIAALFGMKIIVSGTTRYLLVDTFNIPSKAGVKKTFDSLFSILTGTANKVFATPNGSTGQASLRSLVVPDLPKTATYPPETQIGIQSNISSWNNLAQWKPTGTQSVALNGSAVRITSSSNTGYTSYVQYQPDNFTCLDHWKISVTYKISAWGAGSSLFAIGVHGTNPTNVLDDILMYQGTSSTGAGPMTAQTNQSSLTTIGTSTGFTNHLNDVITATMTFDDSLVTFTSTNITTGVTATPITYNFIITNTTSPKMPNTHTVALWYFSDATGAIDIQNITTSSTDTKNPNHLGLVDSKYSYTAPNFKSRWFASLNTTYPTFAVNGGQGDRVADVILRKNEILGLNAQNVWLQASSNDLRFGRTLAQLEADILTVKSWFDSTSTKFYFFILPEDSTKSGLPGSTLRALHTWAGTNIPGYVAAVYNFMQTSDVLKSDMEAADGIHLASPRGHVVVDSILRASGLVTVIDPSRLDPYTYNDPNLQVIGNRVGLQGTEEKAAFYVPHYDASLNKVTGNIKDTIGATLFSPDMTKLLLLPKISGTVGQFYGRLESVGPNSGYILREINDPGKYFFMISNNGFTQIGGTGSLYNYLSNTNGNWQLTNANTLSTIKNTSAFSARRDITYSANSDDGSGAAVTVDSITLTLNSTGPWLRRGPMTINSSLITAATAQNVNISYGLYVEAPRAGGSAVLLNNHSGLFRGAPAKYWNNMGSLFDARSLVDKNYVDSSIAAGGGSVSSGNPTGLIGLTRVNGSASTYKRSDGTDILDTTAHKAVFVPVNFNNAKTINYNGYGAYYNGGYSLYDSIRFTYFLKPDTLLAEGNSITVGQGATTPTTGGYAYLASTKLGIPIVNGALSGSGMWHSIADHNARHTPGMSVMTTVMAGFNDVRRNGLGATKKICNALNAIFINQFLKSSTPGGTVGTRYGAGWGTNYTSSVLGGKSVGNGGFTINNNDSLVYSFTDTTLVLGLMGADGSGGAYSYSTFDVYIDNVLKGHYTENNQTDGVSDGVNDNKRSPMALFYTGLGSGAHSVRLVNTGTTGASYFVVDYIGHLVDGLSASPLVVFEAPKMDATGYATSPNLATDPIIDAINASLDSTVALLPAPYKVIVVKTNNRYVATTASGLSADHIHPNDVGHGQIAQAFYDAANYSNPSNGSITQDGTHFYSYMNGVPVQMDNSANTVTGTGAGTTNALPRYNGPNAITNSSFNDNGTVSYTTQNFGVGGVPSERLHVTGTNPSLLLENSSTQRGYVNQFGNFLQFGINRNPGTGTINNASAGTAALQLEQGSGFGKIHFLVSSANNVVPTEQFTMLMTSGVGYLGIGNNAPISRVDIVGTHPDIRLYDTLAAVNIQSIMGQLNGLAMWGVNRSPVNGLTSNVNRAAAEIRQESNNGESLIHFFTTTTNNATPTERLTIGGNGSILAGTTTPVPSSLFTMSSTTQGILVPRLTTTQQNAISSPATWLLIWNTDSATFCYYSGTAWLKISGSSTGGTGISTLNTLTGSTQTFATGTSGTDFGISSTGTTHTFNIPDASNTARGLITTGTQNINGVKTFSNPPKFINLALGSPTDSLLGRASDGTLKVVSSSNPLNINDVGSGRSMQYASGDTAHIRSIYVDGKVPDTTSDGGVLISTAPAFVQTADVSVTNTSTTTSIFGTGTGSQTFAANVWAVGKTITVKGYGYVSTAASAPTLTITFANSSSNAGNGVGGLLSNSMNNAPIEWEYTATVRTTGSSGTIQLNGWVSIAGTKAYISSSAASFFNTTVSQTFDVTALFGTASTSNTITTKQCTITVR